MATKRQETTATSDIVVTFTDSEKQQPTKNIVISNPPSEQREIEEPVVVVKSEKPRQKVVWDKPTGSIVDPTVLGSVIEDFLNKKTSTSPDASTPGTPTTQQEQSKGSTSKSKTSSTSSAVAIDICDNQPKQPQVGSSGGLTPDRNKQTEDEEETEAERCNSSLCSTIKDLFVK